MTMTAAHHPVGDRVAGAVLVAAGLLIPLGMLHHPTRLDSALVSPLHGAMLALLFATTYGFAHQAIALGIRRPPVLAGAVLYAMSAVANLLTTTMNGFVAPRLAAGGFDGDQLRLLWEVTLVLAEAGVLSGGAAIALWSVAWLRRAGRSARLVASAGLLTGVLSITLLLVGLVRMDLHGATIVYTLQAAWGVLMGWVLFTGPPASVPPREHDRDDAR